MKQNNNIKMSKAKKNEKKRKRLQGRIVSVKMQKTLVVEVSRIIVHPVYKKRLIRSKNYKVHYAKGEYKVGDKIQIEESSPLSKDKRWVVITRK